MEDDLYRDRVASFNLQLLDLMIPFPEYEYDMCRSWNALMETLIVKHDKTIWIYLSREDKVYWPICWKENGSFAFVPEVLEDESWKLWWKGTRGWFLMKRLSYHEGSLEEVWLSSARRHIAGVARWHKDRSQ